MRFVNLGWIWSIDLVENLGWIWMRVSTGIDLADQVDFVVSDRLGLRLVGSGLRLVFFARIPTLVLWIYFLNK